MTTTLWLSEAQLWTGDAHVERGGAPAVGPEPAVPNFVDCDHLALGSAAVPMRDALVSVLTSELAAPPDVVVIAHPTHWGGPRRSLLHAAASRIAASAELVPVALSDGARRMGRRGFVSGRSRCVVLEFAPLGTTASYVGYDSRGGRIEACEHVPSLAATELPSSPVAQAEFSTLLAAVAADRPVDAVLVIGDPNAAVLDVVERAVQGAYPAVVGVRPVTGRELVRAAAPPIPAASTMTNSPASEPEPDPFEASPGTPRWWLPAGGIALVLAVIVGSVGVRSWHDKSSHNPAVDVSKITVGRVTASVPPGWKVRQAVSGESPDIIRIVPDDGSRRRILLSEQSLHSTPSLDDVVADLQAQRADPDKQARFGEPVREIFGGRATVEYDESVEGNSQVKHHVMVEHGARVSVDCQYLAGEWDEIAGACERVVASVEVGP